METEMIDLKKQQNNGDNHNGSNGHSANEPVQKKIDPWSEEALAKLPRHVRGKERTPIPDEARFALKSLIRQEFWAWYSAILGSIPGKIGWVIRTPLYRPFFKHLGKDAHIADGVFIRFPENLSLGDGAGLSHCSVVSALGGLTIGNNAGIGPFTVVDTFTHSTFDHDRIGQTQGIEAAPVVLEDNGWVGSHCYVTPGVTIKTGSFVGANSVVTHDIPPYIVAAGVPARPIFHRRPTNAELLHEDAKLGTHKSVWSVLRIAFGRSRK